MLLNLKRDFRNMSLSPNEICFGLVNREVPGDCIILIILTPELHIELTPKFN